MAGVKIAAEKCPSCGHVWVPRKKSVEYVPRRRCPNCFVLLTPRKQK